MTGSVPLMVMHLLGQVECCCLYFPTACDGKLIDGEVIFPARPGPSADGEIADKLSTSTLLEVIDIARACLTSLGCAADALRFLQNDIVSDTDINSPGELSVSIRVSIDETGHQRSGPRIRIVPAPVPLTSLTSTTALLVNLTVPSWPNASTLRP